jgi:hypothetical protein
MKMLFNFEQMVQLESVGQKTIIWCLCSGNPDNEK